MFWNIICFSCYHHPTQILSWAHTFHSNRLHRCWWHYVDDNFWMLVTFFEMSVAIHLVINIHFVSNIDVALNLLCTHTYRPYRTRHYISTQIIESLLMSNPNCKYIKNFIFFLNKEMYFCSALNMMQNN